MNPAYTRVDRMLHHMAFRTIGVQKTLAELEDSLHSSTLTSIQIERPVFVTSLPRAGTTLLLELLASLSEFASHTYRDMPFLLCPLLWNRVSRRFQKNAERRERAHADGIAIGYDSPEAFEEVLWTTFWTTKYHSQHIEPWNQDDRHDEFELFFRNHMRKIIALRRPLSTSKIPARYLSKNNANIARIELLQEIFPDCRILVPFRNPRDHAASLLRQHLHFSKLHKQDPFARRYMEWLGHFDFGEALRPINFDSWCRSTPAPECRDFWLEYWCATFRALLARTTSHVVLIDYDKLCMHPERGLQRIAEFLDLADANPLVEQHKRFRPPTSYEPASYRDPKREGSAADEVYHELTRAAR